MDRDGRSARGADVLIRQSIVNSPHGQCGEFDSIEKSNFEQETVLLTRYRRLIWSVAVKLNLQRCATTRVIHERRSITNKGTCGPWSKTGGCGLDGKQHFIRDVINSVEPKQKTGPCAYVGPWNRSGGCGTDGKQTYNRIVINSNQPTSKIENCCYMGEWKNKYFYPKNNTLTQVRTRTEGCGGPSTETKDIPNGCRYPKCRDLNCMRARARNLPVKLN